MANFNFKKITLPNGDVGTVYDEEAQGIAAAASSSASKINTNLNNNTYSFLTYKDNTHTEAQIKALTSAKVGDFYIASDTGTAYVCIKAVSDTASASSWEKAGSSTDVSKFVIAENYDGTGTTETVAETFDGHTVEDFVLKENVVNNLTSTSVDVPLSAAQGKVLNDTVTSVETAANNAMPKSGGTMTGKLVAQSNTDYTTKQVRNIILSTAEPTSSDGANGDIWIKYAN